MVFDGVVLDGHCRGGGCHDVIIRYYEWKFRGFYFRGTHEIRVTKSTVNLCI